MRQSIEILNGTHKIPAILWGELSDKMVIGVHGNLSHKADDIMNLVSKVAVQCGYQMLTFDLPNHGDRHEADYELTPQNCISDLLAVYAYAEKTANEISLFACSLGAYFSLLAYGGKSIHSAWFLSPVVDMEKLISGMMAGFGVSEEKLKRERRVELPIGEVLDWDYYTFVRENPVLLNWGESVSILHSLNDEISPCHDIKIFAKTHLAALVIDETGEHFYHTESQLKTVENWLWDVVENMELVSLRKTPEVLPEMLAYVQSKWATEDTLKLYENCMEHCINAESPLPQWYLLKSQNEIVACAGLITNDFISRMDLCPWICAVYVEPARRGKRLGLKLVQMIVKEAAKLGYETVHLCTDHIGYYEKAGFDYIGDGYHPWGESSRVYLKRTTGGGM